MVSITSMQEMLIEIGKEVGTITLEPTEIREVIPDLDQGPKEGSPEIMITQATILSSWVRKLTWSTRP